MKLEVSGEEIARIEGASLAATTLGYRLKVRGVPVAIAIAVTVVDGSLELNIVRATAAGLGLFGIVRAKAAAVLIEKLAPFGEAWKAPNGNVRFGFVSRWRFTAASIRGSVAAIEMEYLG